MAPPCGLGGGMESVVDTVQFRLMIYILDAPVQSNLQQVNCWGFTVLVKDIFQGQMTVGQSRVINLESQPFSVILCAKFNHKFVSFRIPLTLIFTCCFTEGVSAQQQGFSVLPKDTLRGMNSIDLNGLCSSSQ